MMSFCRKSVHSFLGLTNLNCNNYYSSFEPNKSLSPSPSPSPTNTTSPCKHGLGLITDDMGEEAYRSPPRVVESSVMKLLPSSPPSPAIKGGMFLAKKDPGGIGFIDEVGGGVDGLMSCTESLGFESSDERTVDDGVELGMRVESSATASSTSTSPSLSLSLSSRAKWRNKVGERKPRETKKYPPPLSSFNHNGQPSFFLRPVRKDGRLELTEVRIERPEILRAYRKDGRLRLHLVRPEDDFDTHDELKEEEEQNYNQEIQQQQQQNYQDQEEEEEEGQEKEEEIEEKLMEEDNHGEEIVGEWKFPVTGEGFRRCNEPMVAHDYHEYPHHNHHHHHHNMCHHHNLHVWGQHYVTTR